MIRPGLLALLSHWRRRPFQLLTLVLGLATATALWSGVQAINAEARSSYDRAATALGPAPRDEVAADRPLTMADFVALRRAGWQVTPVVEGRVRRGELDLRILGVDPFTLPLEDLPQDAGAEAFDATFLTAPGVLIAAHSTAAEVAAVDAGDAPALPPVTQVDGVAPGLAYSDVVVAQALLGRGDGIDRILVTGPGSLTRTPLEDIDAALRIVPAPAAGEGDLARLTDSFHLNLTAFGLLSFAVGLFIVRGAIGLAFEQRRPVFRTLRALGMSLRVLLGLLMAELLVLALASGAVGMGLGYAIASALLPDVAATLRGLYGADVGGALTIEPAWWAAGLGIAVLGTGIAAAGSLWQVARLPLLAPAQPRAWARASAAALHWQLAASAALLALALLMGTAGAAVTGSPLVAGFVLLGALLIAAALALPPVLHAALSLGARTARGPLTEWFWADTRQQLPGLSLALMALMLALAANIGVGTMVSSFRLTFTGWLDQRLAAELYVSASSDAEAARLRDWLGPRVDAVLPIRDVDAELRGLPLQIFGVADDATYRDHWPLIDEAPGVWDDVAAGRAALVNEQLARRDDLWPGASVALPGGALPVAGVYSDYGNPLAQVLVGLDLFAARFPDAPDRNFGLRLPLDDVPAVRMALEDEFGLAQGNVVDQAGIKALSLEIFDRTFTVTGALNVLTLAVAGFAILTSLLTLAAMRRPQLAPVWALGLTRRRLAWLEVLRALLLAALTMLAALPVGLLLAWVLLAVINVEAFGWRLPMHVFPRDWALLLGLSVVAAVAASALPALRLSRTPPADLLKVFANER